MRYIIPLIMLTFIVSCDKPTGLKFGNEPIKIQPACRIDLGRRAYTAYWDKFEQYRETMVEYYFNVYNLYQLPIKNQIQNINKYGRSMQSINKDLDSLWRSKIKIDLYNIQYCK